MTLAPISFISDGQVNYQVPPGTPTGRADVKVILADKEVAGGVLQVRSIAPTLFGTAEIVRVKSDGTQAHENTLTPIEFGSDRLVLILYGTGFTQVSGLNRVTLTIGTQSVPVQYAGPQNQFPGLDQINAELPFSLAGKGDVTVAVTVESKPANSLTFTFR